MSGRVAASSPDQKIARRQSDVVGRELADGEGGRWSVRVVGARPTMTASSRRQTLRKKLWQIASSAQLSSEQTRADMSGRAEKWRIRLPGPERTGRGGGGYTHEKRWPVSHLPQ